MPFFTALHILNGLLLRYKSVVSLEHLFLPTCSRDIDENTLRCRYKAMQGNEIEMFYISMRLSSVVYKWYLGQFLSRWLSQNVLDRFILFQLNEVELGPSDIFRGRWILVVLINAQWKDEIRMSQSPSEGCSWQKALLELIGCCGILCTGIETHERALYKDTFML